MYSPSSLTEAEKRFSVSPPKAQQQSIGGEVQAAGSSLTALVEHPVRKVASRKVAILHDAVRALADLVVNGQAAQHGMALHLPEFVEGGRLEVLAGGEEIVRLDGPGIGRVQPVVNLAIGGAFALGVQLEDAAQATPSTVSPRRYVAS